MSTEIQHAGRGIPPEALDDIGALLSPAAIPLAALMDPREIIRFAESVAELTQMECSVLPCDPVQPRPLAPGGDIQVLRAPICRALSEVRVGNIPQCVLDVHTAAHAAMRGPPGDQAKRVAKMPSAAMKPSGRRQSTYFRIIR